VRAPGLGVAWSNGKRNARGTGGGGAQSCGRTELSLAIWRGAFLFVDDDDTTVIGPPGRRQAVHRERRRRYPNREDSVATGKAVEVSQSAAQRRTGQIEVNTVDARRVCHPQEVLAPEQRCAARRDGETGTGGARIHGRSS